MKITFSATAALLLLLFFVLVPALAQEGPDEIESNDTRSLADFIDGFVIEGEIGRGDDEDDWFVLDGQEGFNPTFTIYYDDDECDIDFDVYSEDDLVGTADDVDSPDSVTCHVPGACYIHVYIFEGHGEYTIEIEPQRDECEGPDEVEPNDEEDLADLIEGLEIEGYACEDDIDWFLLDGQEGVHPTITLIYDDDECDIDLDVWSGDDLVGSLDDVDSPDSDDFRVPEECWIMVYAFEGEGEYTIEIEP